MSLSAPPGMRIASEGEDHVEFRFDSDSSDYSDDDLEELPPEDATEEKKKEPRPVPPLHICEAPTCSKEAHYRCSVCWDAWYCSQQCQRRDWAKHKKVCTPKPRPEPEPRPNKPKRRPPVTDDAADAVVPDEVIIVEPEVDPLVPEPDNE